MWKNITLTKTLETQSPSKAVMAAVLYDLSAVYINRLIILVYQPLRLDGAMGVDFCEWQMSCQSRASECGSHRCTETPK